MIVYLQRNLAAFAGQINYLAIPGITQQVYSGGGITRNRLHIIGF